MTRSVRQGLIVAAIHVGIAASLGAKLLVDRANYPRAWARTAPYDPNLPIRGRYVQLRVEAAAGDAFDPSIASAPGNRGNSPGSEAFRVTLSADNGQLTATTDVSGEGPFANHVLRAGPPAVVLLSPVAFFIPEHVPDPSIRPAGEELWVEVTLPPKGPVRPIRLGIKRGDVLTPMALD